VASIDVLSARPSRPAGRVHPVDRGAPIQRDVLEVVSRAHIAAVFASRCPQDGVRRERTCWRIALTTAYRALCASLICEREDLLLHLRPVARPRIHARSSHRRNGGGRGRCWLRERTRRGSGVPDDERRRPPRRRRGGRLCRGVGDAKRDGRADEDECRKSRHRTRLEEHRACHVDTRGLWRDRARSGSLDVQDVPSDPTSTSRAGHPAPGPRFDRRPRHATQRLCRHDHPNVNRSGRSLAKST